MEQHLLRLYRRLPKWMKQLVSPNVRDVVLRGMVFFDSKPDLKRLELQRAATAAERAGDWEEAVRLWQFTQALVVSETSPEDGDTDMGRKALYAKNRLRHARVKFAFELYQHGRMRAFQELCSRIAESVPDQRILKNDGEVLSLMRLYVQRALSEEGFEPASIALAAPKRIVVCMDVLKVSKIHTHVRVIFAMCRNLLRLDPDIEISVVITGERYVAPTPITATSFLPLNEADLTRRASIEFGADYGRRIELKMVRAAGLDALVGTCEMILSCKPDVVLYGGGHKGMFSNESRVVRHSLFDFLPTAFFFIQSNNEVDEKIDAIIARGPHDIIGPHQSSAVRVQPYPTMDPDAASVIPEIDPAKQAGKTIVSAIAGVRMTQKVSELTDRTQREVFSVLDRVPDAIWHFVGAQEPELFLKRNPVARTYAKAGRIVVHPLLPMKEFKHLVENASLFYHMPGFTGGSGGATVARRAGVPIITFNHSDVSGRQPDSTVFTRDQVSESADLAVALLSDVKVWTDTVQAQITHTEWIRQTAPQGFYQCLEEAVKRAHLRVTQRGT